MSVGTGVDDYCMECAAFVRMQFKEDIPVGAYSSSLFRIAAVGLFSVSLAACGGGSGSPVTPALAQSPATGGSVASASSATVPVSITMDGTTTSSSSRTPMYFSPSTQSMTIAVALGSGTPVSTTVNCTSTCSGTIQAPLGSDLFTVSLFDRPNAGGSMLSSGSSTTTIRAGISNAVALTMSGVVASVAMTAPTTFEIGVSGSQSIAVTAKDPDGNTISGTYYHPVTITDTDTSGTTSLSTSTISGSGSSFSVNYNGGNGFTGAVVSASAPGMLPASAPAISIGPSADVPVTITAS